MENMRRIAYEIVLRACGFGSLAIFCVMIGMSFEPTLAFKAGGFLTTLMSAILILKAYEARTNTARQNCGSICQKNKGPRKNMPSGRAQPC